MDIKGDDQLSGAQQWLTKSLTEEKTMKSFSKVREERQKCCLGFWGSFLVPVLATAGAVLGSVRSAEWGGMGEPRLVSCVNNSGNCRASQSPECETKT